MADIQTETVNAHNRWNDKIEQFIQMAIDMQAHRDTPETQLGQQMADIIKNGGEAAAYSALVPRSDVKALNRYMTEHHIPHITLTNSPANDMSMIVVDSRRMMEVIAMQQTLRQLGPHDRAIADSHAYLAGEEAIGEDKSLAIRFDRNSGDISKDEELFLNTIKNKMYADGTGHSIAYIQNILDYDKTNGKILATAPIIAARLNAGALSERNRMDLATAIMETSIDMNNTGKEIGKDLSYAFDEINYREFVQKIQHNESAYLCDAYNESPMYLKYDAEKGGIYSYIPETNSEHEVLGKDDLAALRSECMANGKDLADELSQYMSGVTASIHNMKCVSSDERLEILSKTTDEIAKEKALNSLSQYRILKDVIQEAGSQGKADLYNAYNVSQLSLDDLQPIIEEKSAKASISVRPTFDSNDLLIGLAQDIKNPSPDNAVMNALGQAAIMDMVEKEYSAQLQAYFNGDKKHNIIGKVEEYHDLPQDVKMRKIYDDLKNDINNENGQFRSFMSKGVIDRIITKNPIVKDNQDLKQFLLSIDMTGMKQPVKGRLLNTLDRVDVVNNKDLKSINDKSDRLKELSDKAKARMNDRDMEPEYQKD